jgi:hypothetical protein
MRGGRRPPPCALKGCSGFHVLVMRCGSPRSRNLTAGGRQPWLRLAARQLLRSHGWRKANRGGS